MTELKRCYMSNKNTSYQAAYADMMKDESKPVFIISIETTGLEKCKSEIVEISALKCHFEGRLLVEDETYSTLVRPTAPITDEMIKIVKISNEELASAPDITTAMRNFYNYIGSDANVIGFNTVSFMMPMLKYAGFQSGYMLDIKNCVDIMCMAQSCMPLKSYSFRNICDILSLKDESKLTRMRRAFNWISEMLPTGTGNAVVLRSKYWKKSYNCRFIFFTTDHGDVSLNCANGYWQEKVPGFFDSVNMDALTKYVCDKTGSKNIWDFIHKNEK